MGMQIPKSSITPNEDLGSRPIRAKASQVLTLSEKQSKAKRVGVVAQEVWSDLGSYLSIKKDIFFST
jgi:hypothetical protein